MTDTPSQTSNLSAPAATGAIAAFGNGFFIHGGKALPQFDQGPVQAYAASITSDVSQVTHFAMVCEPYLTPRSHSAAAYSTITNPNLVKLATAGPLYWPPARGERYCFIYELPPGRPLCPEGQYSGLGMKPEAILNGVLRPLVYALKELGDADMGHGNIRPSTIYGMGSTLLERIVLSECLSCPASYHQKALFNPLERAMAMPLGRGPASIADDLYALGATLAVLLRTRDPMEGMSEDETIRFRIEHGSLAAMTGKDRISGNIIELLRGLLHDDRIHRWTVQDVNAWLDGQHLSPKQGLKRSKAARPIQFANERYFRPALLAMDLNHNQPEAAQIVETRALEQWISRSLEDSTVLKRLETAVDSAEEFGHGPGYWDRLLARVSIALDPEAPIRYKGLAVFPEGIGIGLTDAFVTHANLQPYIDLINQQLPTVWVSAQTPDAAIDIGSIVSRFDSCRAFLRQSNIAYGIERCLYFLNPDCPCLSDKLRGHYVRNPEDVLRAFEKMAHDSHPELFLDRHVIAFLSVKDRQVVDAFLIELNAEEAHRKILGNIKVLATIQQRSRMEKLPGICKWIAEILNPVYDRIHDRELRQSLKKKVAHEVENGDISRLANVLTSQQTLGRDTDSFNQARMEYHELRLEQAALEHKLQNPSIFGRGTGRQIGAMLSCILSFVAILFFAYLVFTKGSVF